MSSKAFNLAPRKPTALSEEAARKLEDAIAARGEGVAGAEVAPAQVEPATDSAVSRLHSMPAEASPESERHSRKQAQTPSRRTKEKDKGRASASDAPLTGPGTIRNPRLAGRGVNAGVKTRSGTVHLPVELAKKLGVYCAQVDRTKSDVIAEALQAFLDE